MKLTSKRELIEAIEREHRVFMEVTAPIPRARYEELGVWGDGWTLKDLFAHLTEWEQMFLRWYRVGLTGGTPALPAAGYRWNETPRLNRAIWEKHRHRSWRAVRRDFGRSYAEILELARSLTKRQLLTPGHFPWTKKLPLVSYLGPNTCSHYRTAAKIVKRWKRQQGLS